MAARILPKDMPALRADMVGYFQSDDRQFGGPAVLARELASMSFAEKAKVQPSGTHDPNFTGRDYARRIAAGFKSAELFYVNTAMAELAMEAGSVLPDFELVHAILPAEVGFVVWEKPVASLNLEPDRVPARHVVHITAALWWAAGGGCTIMWLVDRETWITASLGKAREQLKTFAERDMVKNYVTYERQIRRVVPALTQMGSSLHRFGEKFEWDDPLIEDDEHEYMGFGAAERALATTWILMRQEKARESRVQPPKSASKRLTRMDPAYLTATRYIELRRAPAAKDSDAGVPQDYQPQGHRYSVRFTRRPHWRHFKSARFSEELRAHPIWIDESDLVGPAGAPIKMGEKVNYLKR